MVETTELGLASGDEDSFAVGSEENEAPSPPTKRYECTILYDATESFFQAAKRRSEELFEEHKISLRDEVDLGVQRLSYPIKKRIEGHYYVYEFEAVPSALRAFSKDLKTQEHVLRFLVVHLDKKAIAFRERRRLQKAPVRTEVGSQAQ